MRGLSLLAACLPAVVMFPASRPPSGLSNTALALFFPDKRMCKTGLHAAAVTHGIQLCDHTTEIKDGGTGSVKKMGGERRVVEKQSTGENGWVQWVGTVHAGMRYQVRSERMWWDNGCGQGKK